MTMEAVATFHHEKVCRVCGKPVPRKGRYHCSRACRTITEGWPPERTARLLELDKLGWSLGAIAKEFEAFGVTRNAIGGRLDRLKHPDGVRGERRIPKVSIPRQFKPFVPGERGRVRPSKPVIPREGALAAIPLFPSMPTLFTTMPLGEPASLMERHPIGCCWSVDHRDGQHIFCNANKLQFSSYCPEHHARGYVVWRAA